MRKLTKQVQKYVPQPAGKKFNTSGVGTSGKIRPSGKKDLKGKVKSSKRKYADPAFSITGESEAAASLRASLRDHDFNGLASEDEEKDEFDDLINDKPSLSQRIGINDSTEYFERFNSKKDKNNLWDDLDDDEEYQNMSEAERNEKMAPKMNLDGAIPDFDSSDDDEQITGSNGMKKKTKQRILEDDDSDFDPKDDDPMTEVKDEPMDMEDEIPDLDDDDFEEVPVKVSL